MQLTKEQKKIIDTRFKSILDMALTHIYWTEEEKGTTGPIPVEKAYSDEFLKKQGVFAFGAEDPEDFEDGPGAAVIKREDFQTCWNIAVDMARKFIPMHKEHYDRNLEDPIYRLKKPVRHGDLTISRLVLHHGGLFSVAGSFSSSPSTIYQVRVGDYETLRDIIDGATADGQEFIEIDSL